MSHLKVHRMTICTESADCVALDPPERHSQSPRTRPNGCDVGGLEDMTNAFFSRIRDVKEIFGLKVRVPFE